ncbi:MAG: hypothetical protein PHO48_01870 [Candidatus Gracilibacteria bacterium]|nr:hypothetical protein [Candidatus Gracilibacteria bacterium]MDD5178896.1 hypothetical protein [Candidatus Gracilibacteria bacterium]
MSDTPKYSLERVCDGEGLDLPQCANRKGLKATLGEFPADKLASPVKYADDFDGEE